MELISGAKISAQVPGPVGGVTAACAVPVPAMVSPAAAPGTAATVGTRAGTPLKRR